MVLIQIYVSCAKKKPDEGESLHRISKNPNVRHVWIAFCKLDESIDDVSKVFICSKHFLPADYIEPRAREFGKSLFLKPGSIPSILKPQMQGHLIASMKLDMDMKLQCSSQSEPQSDPGAGCSSQEQNPDKTSKKRKFSMENVTVETEMPSDNLQDELELNPKSSEQSHGQFLKTPKKQRLCEPRYVGDVQSPHFTTPRRAKRCINLAKRTISHQKQKIRSLQQKNRGLVKKIKHLDALIDHLKKKNLISEGSADTMVANLPVSIKEMVARKLLM